MRSPGPTRLLILGGTSEATTLAHALADNPDYAPTLSLAGRTKSPILPPIPHRIGGFGGTVGLATYLKIHEIDLLIDATHPFAAQITQNALQAAHHHSIPLLRIDRPAWHPVPGDRWTHVTTTTQAAQALGTTPRRVFLTIGQQELAPFQTTPHHYLIRSIDPPPPHLHPRNTTLITARGPFTEAAEIALLQSHQIEIIITKNSGAASVAAKLAAARSLGIPVIMISRPASPACPTVADAEGAMLWIQEKASTSFFAKKEAKKTLIPLVRGRETPAAPD